MTTKRAWMLAAGLAPLLATPAAAAEAEGAVFAASADAVPPVAELGSAPVSIPEAQAFPQLASIDAVEQTSWASAASIAAAPPPAEAESGSAGSGWEFAYTQFGWLPKGKQHIETPQGEEFDARQSLSDYIHALKFAFEAAFEAKHGRFVSVHDIIWGHLAESADGHIGPIPLEAGIDLKVVWTTHQFGYRVVDKGPLFVDLLAGAAFHSVKIGLDVTGPQQKFERNIKGNGIGPMVGARVGFPLGGKWGVLLYGDLRGFGVNSSHAWNLMGTVHYDLSDHWRLWSGWRHFDYHIEKGDSDLKGLIDGPIVGVSYRF